MSTGGSPNKMILWFCNFYVSFLTLRLFTMLLSKPAFWLCTQTFLPLLGFPKPRGSKHPNKTLSSEDKIMLFVSSYHLDIKTYVLLLWALTVARRCQKAGGGIRKASPVWLAAIQQALIHKSRVRRPFWNRSN